MAVEYTGLDLESAEYRALVTSLQGNILKSHGRDHTAMVLLRFASDGTPLPAVRRWLAALGVTSAWDQHVAAEARRSGQGDSAPFVGLYLTVDGYRALGVPRSRIPRDVAFRQGLPNARAHLHDPPSDAWESPWRRVNAIVLFADDRIEVVEACLDRTHAALAACGGEAEIVGIERAAVLRTDRGLAREHFGFVDGISQPLYLRRDVNAWLSATRGEGWDPTANPFYHVLVSEPGQVDGYGSLVVIRKLQQDVDRFRRNTAQMKAALGLPEPAARAGAMALGRWPDGTPLAVHAAPAGSPSNAFDHAGDPGALRCPLASHARRMNARDGDPQSRARRIARRGVPYEDGEHRGLLFVCFQRDISRQFESLQRWANGDVPASGGTLDPIVGQTSPWASPRPQRWPVRWGEPGQRSFMLHGHVTMRGGAYCFAPSIPFVRSLLDP